MAEEVVVVRLSEVREALFDGIDNSKELRRAYRDFIDDIEATWKHIWETDKQGALASKLGTPHPYQTGDYIAHLKKRMPRKYQRIKNFLKSGMPIGAVYNDSDVSHFVEYGTDEDKPGSRSPWGPKTETPEFAPMRKTVARYLV